MTIIKSKKSAISSNLKNFFSKFFVALLISLFLLFVFRPHDRGNLYVGIWQFAFTIVFLASVLNSHHHRSTKIIACSIGIPALLLNWSAYVFNNPYYFLLHTLLTFLFIAICASSIISRVILHAKVTLETLRGAVCVYFMIAFGFSYLYLLIEYLIPGSFYFIEGELKLSFESMLHHNHILSELFFFSFVTLLTIGFGTIHALSDVAQTATILEGILGQFYIAILVSRIISVYSFYSHKEEKEPVVFPEKEETTN